MKRVRLATCGVMAWAGLAGLLSGCQSADPCCRPSLLSRLGFGCRSSCCTGMIHQAPATAPAAPVSMGPFMNGVPFTGLPVTPECCDGGPLPPSAVPGESMYSGPILSPGPTLEGYPGPALLAPGKMGAPIFLPPSGPGVMPSTPAPGGTVPAPPPTLPAPMPEPGAPMLTPVPNGGFAQPTPANPSSRRR